MTPTLLAREPWLVRSDDFVSAEEAARLLALLEDQPLRADETGHVGEVGELRELDALHARVSHAVGLDTQVRSIRYRRYETGEGHPLHPDDYSIDGAHLVATAMLVLSAPDAGGATEFPDARPYPASVSPRAFALVHWRNVLPNGLFASRSLHRAAPVLGGRKAVLLFFFYVPLEAFVATEARLVEAHAALASRSVRAPAPAPGTQLTCIVDEGLPGETTRLLREACGARGVLYRQIEARTFDYEPSSRLPAGAMLYRPAASRAASHVEEYLIASDVATFHGELEGTFFPCAAPHRVRERAGLDAPRTFPIASTDPVLLASFVERLGGFPVVVKVGGGEGGLGVMRADSLPALGSLIDYLVRGQGAVPMLSAYVAEAMHHRVVVVGDRAVASYENPIREHDFRSTPSERAEDYRADVPETLAKLAILAVKAERLAFGGVDLIVHSSGRAYVLEVNYPCFFPQATLVAGIDVAGPMLDYLVARAKALTSLTG